MTEPYEIYVEKYGKIKSGASLLDSDFGELSDPSGGFVKYDEEHKLAVTLAAQDAKHDNLRSKVEFQEELTRLRPS